MLDDIFEKSPFETEEEYLYRIQELEEEMILAEEYGYNLDLEYSDPNLDEMDELDRWLYFGED